MAEQQFDLRGTQGAVVLPGGTVVQNYPTPQERETEQVSMNPQPPGSSDLNSRMYDQGRELAGVQANLSGLERKVDRLEATVNQIEATTNQMMTLLQRPSVVLTVNQLMALIGISLVIVAMVLAVSYAQH